MSRPIAAALLGMLVGLSSAACTPPEPAALPPETFAFGVFGDAPYSHFDQRAYRSLIDDVGAADVEFVVHVGDILGGRCSNEVLGESLRSMSSFPVPVVYTPGDNEWADCHVAGAGGYRPLERLDRIRATFFATPASSLGARRIGLESQGASPRWQEFVENARWRMGGFVFSTIHLVGSGNATQQFASRTRAADSAAVRRMSAALHWLDEAFAVAIRDSLAGVVVAIHADPFFELRGPRNPYEPFIHRLEQHTSAFDGAVVLLHGDSHTYRFDHPLVVAGTRDTLRNFARIETFGSPDVGWVRVVVDTTNGQVIAAEPRLMPKVVGI